MVDAGEIDGQLLAKALLMEGHDLVTVDDIRNYQPGSDVDTIEEIAPWQGCRLFYVEYSEIESVEDDAFRGGAIIDSVSLTPDENDAYSSTLVVVFADLVDGHEVILSGTHSGAGVSDDSHEARVCAEIILAPKAMSEAARERMVGNQRKTIMRDACSEMNRLATKIKHLEREEIGSTELAEAMGGLMRTLAKAA